jgi:hypothetical protein
MSHSYHPALFQHPVGIEQITMLLIKSFNEFSLKLASSDPGPNNLSELFLNNINSSFLNVREQTSHTHTRKNVGCYVEESNS